MRKRSWLSQHFESGAAPGCSRGGGRNTPAGLLSRHWNPGPALVGSDITLGSVPVEGQGPWTGREGVSAQRCA